MGVRQLTATEAARRFSEVLDAVEHAGEIFVVTRGGRAVASIGPAPAMTGRELKAALRRHRPDAVWAHDLRELRRGLEVEERSWPD
jgi:prevent-host-death family protein